jgi:MoaA/NifB/PqqE/SkfB family radical SAM enzyme
MLRAGARAFIYIQYVPAEPGTEDLVPTLEQRDLVIRSMQEFNRKYPAFFIGIPGDMEIFDGCLAAGRGFIHVNPYGDLEPCPLRKHSNLTSSKRYVRTTGLFMPMADVYSGYKPGGSKGCYKGDKQFF